MSDEAPKKDEDTTVEKIVDELLVDPDAMGNGNRRTHPQTIDAEPTSGKK